MREQASGSMAPAERARFYEKLIFEWGPALAPNALSVVLCLAAFSVCVGAPAVRAHKPALSRTTGLSERTLKKTLQGLVENGVVELHQIHGRDAFFSVNLDWQPRAANVVSLAEVRDPDGLEPARWVDGELKAG